MKCKGKLTFKIHSKGLKKFVEIVNWIFFMNFFVSEKIKKRIIDSHCIEIDSNHWLHDITTNEQNNFCQLHHCFDVKIRLIQGESP